jgi:hypothetical protein
MQPHGARPATTTLTFLLGVQPRCGTRTWPERAPIWEDHLLSGMGGDR